MKDDVKEKTEELEVTEVKKNVFQRIGGFIKEEAMMAVGFFKENPQSFVSMITGAVGMGLTIVGLCGGFSRKDDGCEVPDEVTGLNYSTTHPLTNSEIIELSDRIISGESKGEALQNMGVLKDDKR